MLKAHLKNDNLVGNLRVTVVLLLLTLIFLAIPILGLTGQIETFHINRLGRYLCFAILAIGIDLIWGYTGILSLFQAFIFCLGGYAMAMHLSLPQGGGDVRADYNNIPQFFYFNGVEILPSFWQPFSSLPFSLAIGFLVPIILSGILGFFMFRSRVRGVYFAIMTQALAWAAFLAFCRNEMLLGGTNGLTNFFRPLNTEPGWIIGFYLLTASTLLLVILACRRLIRADIGKILVAIRDGEVHLRARAFYPERYKTAIFVLAAGLAALAGMLYVPQNGIITPNMMRVEDSILCVIWVAVGGRGRLGGAVGGALLVQYVYSALTSDLPLVWPFVEGGMFLVVVLYSGGLAGLWDKLESALRERREIFWAILPLITMFLFVVTEALGLVPAWLSLTLFDVPLRYWLVVGILLITALRHKLGEISTRGPRAGLMMSVKSVKEIHYVDR